MPPGFWSRWKESELIVQFQAVPKGLQAYQMVHEVFLGTRRSSWMVASCINVNDGQDGMITNEAVVALQDRAWLTRVVVLCLGWLNVGQSTHALVTPNVITVRERFNGFGEAQWSTDSSVRFEFKCKC